MLFQIPSNLLLCRLGARLWLPLITAAFGVVAVCSALFIRGPASFYALRLALGITEAGGWDGLQQSTLQLPSVFANRAGSRRRNSKWGITW